MSKFEEEAQRLKDTGKDIKKTIVGFYTDRSKDWGGSGVVHPPSAGLEVERAFPLP